MSNSSESRRLRKTPILGELWRRIQTMPAPVVEDSIWLRVLVQTLVIVGMVATDVAAETQLSLWAVPLSVVGAIWSWYRRRDRNVILKFLLAIGMLLALAAFFSRLLGQLNDTRLVLSELLIHLQVLHSFDLPRRKDLGYSMVIGLILLSVAASVSQTLAFAPVLIVFLALALPTLMLDYRSRLGLQAWKFGKRPRWQVESFKYSNWQWLKLFIAIVTLGLIIFAFLPRLPGYQLRTFPVSAPSQFEELSSKFENPGMVKNPGYRRGENGSGSGGSGGTEEEGPGELDETFYYGFNNRINQNLRGQLIPKVVMRVRSQAEGFWRVMAFDRYLGQGWEVSRENQVFTLERSTWSYQFLLPRMATQNRTEEVVQTYTILSDLPNIIPALFQARALYFPTVEVGVDKEGSLRSPLELMDGLTYSVISEVAYRDRTQLRQAPTEYSENIQQFYLQIPEAIAPRIRQETERILDQHNQQLIANSKQPITSAYEKALYLAQYLKQNPKYKLEKEPPFLQTKEDLVEAFLFGYKNSPPGVPVIGGYADHFSTVLTVMLRSIGIPARLVVGFAPGQFNPFTGLYIVKNTDAYAMTEVYFPNHGWFTFDPIPGHDLIPPSVEENETFGVLRHFWKWVAGWLPSPVTNWLQTIFSAIGIGLIRLIRWLMRLFFNGWIGLFSGLIFATFLGFLGWIAWQGWNQWRYRRWLGKLPPVERFYQQMLRVLAEKGFRKHPAQTPFEYAQQSRQYHSDAIASAIEMISRAYVSWRYGGKVANLEQLKLQLDLLKKLMTKQRRRT